MEIMKCFDISDWQYSDRGNVCGHEMDVSEVLKAPWENNKKKCDCGCDCCSK